MRNEKEMYHMILQIAEEDPRIKAVYINGSRTNKNVPKDIFQDYDVVYVVTDTKPFIEDKEWINQFGEIWFMQYPDEHPDYPSDRENFYGWLMQFKDGNRIDLHVESIQHAKEHIKDDKLCKILLDKDNILPYIVEATDEDYFIKKPSKEQFLCTCTEFWWCLNNVAKGLWREELLYVHDMVNFCVRKQLEKVISWEIGIKTDFSVSVGKSAKYMNKWMEQEAYEKYLSTYACETVCDCWKAVFTMIDLFSPTARYVAEQLDYTYNSKEENACMEFLNIVRELPKDAKEIVKNNYKIEKYKNCERFNEQYQDIYRFLLKAEKLAYNEHFHWGRFEWMQMHTLLEEDKLTNIVMFKDENEEIVGMITYDTFYDDRVYLLHTSTDKYLLNKMIDTVLENEEDRVVIKVNAKDEVLSKILQERHFEKKQKDVSVLELDLSGTLDYKISDEYSISPLEFNMDNWKYQLAIHKGFDNAGIPDKWDDEVFIQGINKNMQLNTFAIAKDEYCAHCGLWYTEGASAYVEPVVTIPEHRKKGLARAVIYEACRRAKNLGAKRATVLSDQEFYYKIGFKCSSEVYCWEKNI